MHRFFKILEIKHIFRTLSIIIFNKKSYLKNVSYDYIGDQLRIEPSECAICGDCIDVCPLGLIERQGWKMVVHEGCTNCGDCADICPVEAIHLDDE